LLTLEENTHATAIALDAMTGHWPQGSLVARNESTGPQINANQRK
jgi:hypothetical protein